MWCFHKECDVFVLLDAGHMQYKGWPYLLYILRFPMAVFSYWHWTGTLLWQVTTRARVTYLLAGNLVEMQEIYVNPYTYITNRTSMKQMLMFTVAFWRFILAFRFWYICIWVDSFFLNTHSLVFDKNNVSYREVGISGLSHGPTGLQCVHIQKANIQRSMLARLPFLDGV